MNSPLESVALFYLGPVPITSAVVVTWIIMAVLVLGSMLLTRRLSVTPSARQAALEVFVEAIDGQIRDTTGAAPAPYRAFVGTLFAFIWFGVRGRGIGGYLKDFAAPNPVMIPLNILQSITRVFSMFVRLFGNVMSGVFVIGIVASLAGLFVPIPLMALELLTGLVQAYIFAILAIVFIAATVGESKPASNGPASGQSQ